MVICSHAHPWGSQASLPITNLEVKAAPALQGTVVTMAGEKRPWKCVQQAWLRQDGLIPVVSHLAPSGLNCPGLLGRILGAAPARGPGVAGLPLWADGWWEGKGMQEEGSLHGSGIGQRPGDVFLSKCTLKCVGKQEGAGHGPLAAGSKLGPIHLLVAEVMWTWPLSLLPQMLLQQQRVGVDIQGARVVLIWLPLYLCIMMQSLITRSHTVFPPAPAHSEKKKKKKDVVLQDDSERGSKSSR